MVEFHGKVGVEGVVGIVGVVGVVGVEAVGRTVDADGTVCVFEAAGADRNGDDVTGADDPLLQPIAVSIEREISAAGMSVLKDRFFI